MFAEQTRKLRETKESGRGGEVGLSFKRGAAVMETSETEETETENNCTLRRLRASATERKVEDEIRQS